MTEQLASNERQQPRCEMCERGRAYPPNPYCEACLTYMADCEAEMGSER